MMMLALCPLLDSKRYNMPASAMSADILLQRKRSQHENARIDDNNNQELPKKAVQGPAK